MGRRRTQHHHLPPHMAQKGNAYYYVTSTKPRQWLPLGSDLNQARMKWAEFEQEPLDSKDKTFAIIAERYRREVLKQKAPRTQKDYLKELDRLVQVFGHIPIDAITPQDVREYMNLRGKKAPIRANREKAMLSTLYNHAREWGYTHAANPCAGVKGFKEAGRDRYVEDAEYRAVWDAASPPIRDAMDIAYLTGQRPADVLKMHRADIRDGFLCIEQNKTGKKLRVEIVGTLKDVVERILRHPRPALGLSLIQNEKGQPLSVSELRGGFDRARQAAGVSFQFRDLRAKAATDLEDLPHAQKLLGHTTRDMTEHYTRKRIGETVKPVGTKREKL